uniref:Uncharacterized protein n=1 Tax=Vespula pensylvanica TaxID=30213 RepID=A0A834UAA3_VESPE|nr:hypothetical protein H0235_007925 [Vespula pensylvanica]
MTFFWTSCVVGSSWLAVDCPLPLSFAWDSLIGHPIRPLKTGKDMEIWADRNDREMILRGRREHPAKGSANFHFDVCADESPILRSPTFPPPVTTTTSFQAPRREQCKVNKLKSAESKNSNTPIHVRLLRSVHSNKFMKHRIVNKSRSTKGGWARGKEEQ